MKGLTATVILFIMVAGFFVTLLVPIQGDATIHMELRSQESLMDENLTVHKKIIINSDSELEQMAQEENWSGDGSFFSPYSISHYDIDGHGDLGIYLGNTTKWVIISHCYIHNLTGTPSHTFNAGVLVWHAQNVMVSYSTISYSYYGIMLYRSSSSAFISHNDFHHLVRHAVALQGGSTNAVVSYNVVRNANYGVYIIGQSNNHTVEYNEFYHVDGGIFITQNSIFNRIYHNYINDTRWGDGIGIRDEGKGDIIENNTILRAYRYGIQCTANNATIANNSVMNSTSYGIYVNGTGNLIYQNSFVANNGATEVYDKNHTQGYNKGANGWFYLAKGNYWADWTSPDDDEDGIVDNPYVLDGDVNSFDSYPLADPVAPIPELSIVAPFILFILSALLLRKFKY